MDAFLLDLKYGFRSLWHDKGFVATVLLTFSVCIAANVVLFAIVFPTFDVGGYHRAIFANSGFFEVKKKLRDYSKSEWHKFLYLDDPKVKVKSRGNHARRQPRATNSVTDRRACIE